jgi:putative transposase
LLQLLKKENGVWFWEEGYHGEEIISSDLLQTKVNFINLNPVLEGVVLNEEAYNYSSYAKIYDVGKSALELAEL